MSSIEAKIKNRAANYKRGKNGDVNFRDILRQVNMVFWISLGLFFFVFFLINFSLLEV